MTVRNDLDGKYVDVTEDMVIIDPEVGDKPAFIGDFEIRRRPCALNPSPDKS